MYWWRINLEVGNNSNLFHLINYLQFEDHSLFPTVEESGAEMTPSQTLINHWVNANQHL